jgi:hypothetical protein
MILHRLLEHAICFYTRAYCGSARQLPSRPQRWPSQRRRPYVSRGQRSLTLEDLKFPILLDKSKDGYGIVGESTPKGGRDHPCALRHCNALRSETT